MNIRETDLEDLDAILELYLKVAAIPGGLARLQSEISRSYVESFLSAAIDNGLSLLLEDEHGQVRAEIHAYSPSLYCFSHVLSDLTIAVDPDTQGSGIGRRLFDNFMQRVRAEMPDVRRIELIARESNQKAIGFYESLGFETEGKLMNRIKNLDGSLESDVPMAWQREFN